MYAISFWVEEGASFSGARILDFLEDSPRFELLSDGLAPVRYRYDNPETACQFILNYAPGRIREESSRHRGHRFTGIYAEFAYGQPEFMVYEATLVLKRIGEVFEFKVEDEQGSRKLETLDEKKLTQQWEKANSDVIRSLKMIGGREGDLLAKQRMMQWWAHSYLKEEIKAAQEEDWLLPKVYLLGHEKWKEVRRAVVFQPGQNMLIPDCEAAIVMSADLDPPMMGILAIRDLWAVIRPYLRVGFTQKEPTSRVKIRYQKYLALEAEALTHRLSNTPMMDPDDFFRIKAEYLVSRN